MKYLMIIENHELLILKNECFYFIKPQNYAFYYY